MTDSTPSYDPRQYYRPYAVRRITRHPEGGSVSLVQYRDDDRRLTDAYGILVTRDRIGIVHQERHDTFGQACRAMDRALVRSLPRPRETVLGSMRSQSRGVPSPLRL